jgi:hypothetical protein
MLERAFSPSSLDAFFCNLGCTFNVVVLLLHNTYNYLGKGRTQEKKHINV